MKSLTPEEAAIIKSKETHEDADARTDRVWRRIEVLKAERLKAQSRDTQDHSRRRTWSEKRENALRMGHYEAVSNIDR